MLSTGKCVPYQTHGSERQPEQGEVSQIGMLLNEKEGVMRGSAQLCDKLPSFEQRRDLKEERQCESRQRQDSHKRAIPPPQPGGRGHKKSVNSGEYQFDAEQGEEYMEAHRVSQIRFVSTSRMRRDEQGILHTESIP
jgi:hypothetical protein